MYKKIIPYLLLLAVYSCKPKPKAGLIKTDSGFEYAIIKNAAPADSILAGDMVKVHIQQYVDDSLLNNTFGKLPLYFKNDTSLKKFDFTEIIPLLRINDSAVCYFDTKTIVAKGPKGTIVPPFLKKGKQIIVQVKVIGKFLSDSLAKLDFDKEKMRWDSIVAIQDKKGLAIAAIRYDSLIKTQPNILKLPSGVHVWVVEKGTGAAIKKEDELTVFYKGFTDDGKFFESTNAAKPFEVHIGHNETIPGFETGLASLHFGDSAHIFVPSPLAYGTKPAGNKIPAYANLIFKVRVIKK
jgi:FKBP-type peptidyl-prolyl cis-trans isomerase FkpA